MAFDGNGIFTPVYNWQTDKANGIKIRADRMDGQDDDIATGLTTCVTRDGQSPATANLPMGTYKHTGVGLATNLTDYAAASQLQSKNLEYFTTAGTIDAYTLTPSPAVGSLTTGLTFLVRIHVASAGATPTLAVSGLTATTISNGDLTALSTADLASGGVYQITYQGTAGFVLPNKLATPVVEDPVVWGLTNGGYKTASFTIAADTWYTVHPPTAGLGVTLINSSSGAEKFVMLVKIGAYSMNLMGTVNGATSTIAVTQRQTLTMGCTTVDGWV